MSWLVPPGGSINFDGLSDVDLTGAANNDLLYRSGGSWIDSAGKLTYNDTTNEFKMTHQSVADEFSVTLDGTNCVIDTTGTVNLSFTGRTGSFSVGGNGVLQDLDIIALDGAAPGITFDTSSTFRAGFTCFSSSFVLDVSGTTSNRFDVADGLTSLVTMDSTNALSVFGGGQETDYVTFNHDGTDFTVADGNVTSNFDLVGFPTFRLRDGCDLYIYDSTDTDSMLMRHDGTDFHFTGTNTTWIRNDVTSGTLNLTGMEERWYDEDNSDSIRIEHDGTYGIINYGNLASSQAIKIAATGSDHLFPGFQVLTTQLAADDATVTWNIECNGGLYWVVPGTTTTSENSHTWVRWFSTTTNSVINSGGGSIWAYGTGSNPDTDGFHNIWFTNAGKTMNIKNRRGSSRYYTVYIMSGRA